MLTPRGMLHIGSSYSRHVTFASYTKAAWLGQGDPVAPAKLFRGDLHSHPVNVGQHGQPHSSTPLRPAWPEVAVHRGAGMLQLERLPVQCCGRLLLPIQGQGPNHACQCDWLSLRVKLVCLS